MKQTDNWEKFEVPSHHVWWVKDDPVTGGVIACVDIDRIIRLQRQQAVEEYKKSLLERLNARMRKYANTPLSERRNAYDELYEFEKDILLTPTPKGLDKRV